MPKIISNKSGGKIIYDSEDWLTGQEQIQSSASFNSKLGNGFAPTSQQIDPLRQIGYLTVGFNPVDVTNIASVTGLIKNGVIKGDSAYLIATDKVHKLDSLTLGTINTTSPFPYTIVHGGHTGMTGSDIVNYYVGTTLKAFFSFHDDTDWDVGVYDYTANTFDGDFMSTIPASPLAGTDLTDGKDIEHPLIVGADDILYQGSGRYVHAFDGQTGANGTFSSKVLTLPAGWIITSFTKMPNNKLAIGAYYSSSQGSTTFNKGDAAVWVWGYNELDIDAIYDLNDNYISELFNWNGSVACFTSGRKSISKAGVKKLQVFNGIKFVPVVEWNTGSLPVRGGVEIVGDDIYWNSSGIIYSYTKIPNTDRFAFNWLAGAGSTASGMLKIFTELRAIHFSDGTGTGNGLKSYGSNYRETGIAYGKFAYPDFSNSKKARLTTVAITFLEAVNGGRSFSLNISIDDESPQIISAFTTVSNLKVQYHDRSANGKPFGEFTRIQPILIWSSGSGSSKAPTIEKIEFEYELINI